MSTGSPVVVVALAASAAALTAALGAVPLVNRPRPPIRWLAWASAAAGGLMLAAAFALAEPVPDPQSLQFAAGALVGIAFVHGSRRLSRTAEVPLDRLGEAGPDYGHEVLLVTGLHGAAEGVAIGAAMASDAAFGIFVAVALALHNIPEGTLVAAIFRSRGVGLGRAAMLGVAANLGQLFVAVVIFLAIAVLPPMLPWALGFAAGAFVYLVIVDLLPTSYAGAGPTSIALAVIMAMWAFGLLHGVLRG